MNGHVVWIAAVSPHTYCSECDKVADKWAGRDRWGGHVALCNGCSDDTLLLRHHEKRVAPEYLVGRSDP